MPLLILIADDHEFNENGYHVLNDKGIAKKVQENKEIEVIQEVYDRILPMIEGARIARGLNPDGSIPIEEAKETPTPLHLVEDIQTEEN